MDFFQDQLKNAESIVLETQIEHSRFEETKLKIQKLKKKLFLFNISRMLNNKPFEISYVEVRAYRAMLEVEEISSNFSKNPAENIFFVIDVILPKFLHTILVESELVVNIRVLYGKITISKTFPFNESSAIKEILPAYDSAENCKVEIIFFGKINEKNITLKIKTINVDISYYLMSRNMKNLSEPFRIQEKVVQLCNMYNSGCNRNNFKHYILKYQIHSTLSHKDFIELILKNCYTHINLNNLISDDKDRLHIKNEDFKIFIMYDFGQKIFLLKAHLFDLYRVKKYLLGELDLNFNAEKTKILKLSEFNVHEYNTLSETYKAIRNINFIGEKH